MAVVIPAYNEERFIGSVVLCAKKYADTVIVVDDGSTDATAEIAAEAGAIVVRQTPNQGKGVALGSGLQKAAELDPDVVITIDADGQHVIDEIMSVADPILLGEADIVVGSRYLNGNSHVPQHRVLGHRVFSFITNLISGVCVNDSQSGFRAFSPRALATISFRSNGFSVESEMQFIAQEHGLKMVDAPITIHYYDKPKRPVWRHGLMVLSGILRLTGQYRPLLFLGLPGLLVMFGGVIGGGWVVDIYRRNEQLAVGYALISAMMIMLGGIFLSTGITLHSVRALMLETVRGNANK
jgi:glycosyltransferase involved in cell wall biosynthesis